MVVTDDVKLDKVGCDNVGSSSSNDDDDDDDGEDEGGEAGAAASRGEAVDALERSVIVFGLTPRDHD